MVFLNRGTADDGTQPEKLDEILDFSGPFWLHSGCTSSRTRVAPAAAHEAPAPQSARLASAGNTGNTGNAPMGELARSSARGPCGPRVVIASEAHDHNAQRKTLESFVFSHPPLPFLFSLVELHLYPQLGFIC